MKRLFLLPAVLVTLTIPTNEAHAASISLQAQTGQGCSSLNDSTANVVTGLTLSSSCTVGPGYGPDDMYLNDLAIARGAFGADGLELGVFVQMIQQTRSNELTDQVQAWATFRDDVTLAGGVVGEVGILRSTFVIDGGVILDTMPPLGSGFSDRRITLNGLSVAGPTTLVLDTPLIFGTPGTFQVSFRVDWLILARAPLGTVQRLDVYVDFLNTATLTQMAVFDANGQRVEGGQVLSASGLDYPSATAAAVPEPSTVALVGLILPGLLWIRRR